MDRCSYFVEDRALFGSYPTHQAVEELENNGVRYFVDLTCEGEKKIEPYTTKYNYVRYPIKDNHNPANWKSFAILIIWICNIIEKLENNEKIFVHCKGGHGRSGIVVACVLTYLHKICPMEALRLTKEFHFNRKEMKDIRRRNGAPPKKYQRIFVKKFFSPLYIYKTYNDGITYGLSNFSIHSVKIPDLGTFPTAEAAFQAYKDPENKDYVRRQELAFTPYISRKLGKTIIPIVDWEENKENIMYKIMDLKFTQHPNIMENLLRTGLRPIIEHSSDLYWSDGKDGRGKNVFGKILMKIRNRQYLK